jgi:hypothetical protein
MWRIGASQNGSRHCRSRHMINFLRWPSKRRRWRRGLRTALSATPTTCAGSFLKKYRQKVCVVVSRCCCAAQQQQQSLATNKRVKGRRAGPYTHTRARGPGPLSWEHNCAWLANHGSAACDSTIGMTGRTRRLMSAMRFVCAVMLTEIEGVLTRARARQG